MNRLALALFLFIGPQAPPCNVTYRLPSEDGTRVYAEIIAPTPVRDCVFSFGAK